MTLVLIEATFIFGYTYLEIMEKYDLSKNVNRLVRTFALFFQISIYAFYICISIKFYKMGVRYA